MTKEQCEELNALFEEYTQELPKSTEKPFSPQVDETGFDELWQGPRVKNTLRILSNGTVLSIIIMMCSCTINHGQVQTTYADGRVDKKSHLYASVGSKAKGISSSPEAGEILELDDSVSLRNALTAGVSMYSAWGLLEAQKSNNAVEIVGLKQPQITKRAGISADAAVKTAGIDAGVKKAMIKAGMKP